MKRFLAISLLVLYVNSNTELHEVLRTPLLVEHFTQHKRLVGDISFWQFLVMHYTSSVSHDADDSKLPFKDPAHSFTIPALALPIHKMILNEGRPASKVLHISFYQDTFVASHLSDIFQPPRAV